jgi:ankyrin repeat protein
MHAAIDVASADESVTPLMNAVQGRSGNAIQFLLPRGAKVNAGDKRGVTSLHRACELGQLDAAEVLLEHGARMDLEAEGEHTPLLLVRLRKEQAVVDLLESKLVANEKGPSSE